VIFVELKSSQMLFLFDPGTIGWSRSWLICHLPIPNRHTTNKNPLGTITVIVAD
jgi:hypothetical protein